MIASGIASPTNAKPAAAPKPIISAGCVEVNDMCNADLLQSFRRYKRACLECQHADWAEDVVRQWEHDRKFLKDKYHDKRGKGFSVASEYAHEQLFIRCCGVCGGGLK